MTSNMLRVRRLVSQGVALVASFRSPTDDHFVLPHNLNITCTSARYVRGICAIVKLFLLETPLQRLFKPRISNVSKLQRLPVKSRSPHA